MPNTNRRIAYMHIEYSTAFHMKFMDLFVDAVYDGEQASRVPIIITWSEVDMCTDSEDNRRCLAVAAKTSVYADNLQVSEEFFEDALQAFSLFPDTNANDDETYKLRLEFVKALLNK